MIGSEPVFLNSSVTGDVSWCFRHNPQTKRQSAEKSSSTLSKPKKFCLKTNIKTKLITFLILKGLFTKNVCDQAGLSTAYFTLVQELLLLTHLPITTKLPVQ